MKSNGMFGNEHSVGVRRADVLDHIFRRVEGKEDPNHPGSHICGTLQIR
ncbi:MAG: hypothetical protein SCK57_11450 [Bacillota bacterium]|nr:hypothetical protein [Bacillota bacterium]